MEYDEGVGQVMVALLYRYGPKYFRARIVPMISINIVTVDNVHNVTSHGYLESALAIGYTFLFTAIQYSF